MLKVYCDESADGDQAHVFAMAGLVGKESDWLTIEEKWLGLTKGEVFHAADWEHQGKFDEYKSLTLVLAESSIGGRGVAVDLKAVHDSFPEILADIGYYKCFLMVTGWIVENVAVPLNEPIQFTFDRREQSRFNATKLYESVVRKPDWAPAALMSESVQFDDRQNPRIQMADLVAREAMKDLDRQVRSPERPRRRSIEALYTKGHFNFGVIDQQYCEGWRSDVKKSEREDGIGENLGRWLQKRGLSDNMSNRIAYIDWLQSTNTEDPVP